jgi:hypothetical protein
VITFLAVLEIVHMGLVRVYQPTIESDIRIEARFEEKEEKEEVDNAKSLKMIIEALLFSSDKPLTVKDIHDCIPDADKSEIKNSLTISCMIMTPLSAVLYSRRLQADSSSGAGLNMAPIS